MPIPLTRERLAPPRTSPRSVAVLPVSTRDLSDELTPGGPVVTGVPPTLREPPPPAPLPWARQHHVNGEATSHNDLRRWASTEQAAATSLALAEPPLARSPGGVVGGGSPPRIGARRPAGSAPPLVLASRGSPQRSSPTAPQLERPGFVLPSRDASTSSDLRAAVCTAREETLHVHRAELHLARSKALRATTAGSIRTEAVAYMDASPRAVAAEAQAWGPQPHVGDVADEWARKALGVSAGQHGSIGRGRAEGGFRGGVWGSNTAAIGFGVSLTPHNSASGATTGAVSPGGGAAFVSLRGSPPASPLVNGSAGAVDAPLTDAPNPASVGRGRSVLHWDTLATLSAPYASAAVVHEPRSSLSESLLLAAKADTQRGASGSDTFYSSRSLASPDVHVALFSPRHDAIPIEQRAAHSAALRVPRAMGDAPVVSRASSPRRDDVSRPSNTALQRDGSASTAVSSSSAPAWAPGGGGGPGSSNSSTTGSSSGSSMHVYSAAALAALPARGSPRPASAAPTLRAGDHVDLRDGHTLHALVSQERAAASAAKQRALMASRGLVVAQPVEAPPGGVGASLSISRDRHIASARARALGDHTSVRPGNSTPGTSPRRYDEYGNETRSARGLAPAWVHHSAVVDTEGSMLAPVHSIPLSVRDWGKYAGGASSPRKSGGAVYAAASLSARFGGEAGSYTPGGSAVAGSGGVAARSFSLLSTSIGGGGDGSALGDAYSDAALQQPAGGAASMASIRARTVAHTHVQARVWSPRAARPEVEATGHSSGVAAAAMLPDDAELCIDDPAYAGKLVAGTLAAPPGGLSGSGRRSSSAKQRGGERGSPSRGGYVSNGGDSLPQLEGDFGGTVDGEDSTDGDDTPVALLPRATPMRTSGFSQRSGSAHQRSSGEALLEALVGRGGGASVSAAGGEGVVPRNRARRAVDEVLGDSGRPFLAAQRVTAHEISLRRERRADRHSVRVTAGTMPSNHALGMEEDEDDTAGGSQPLVVLNDTVGSVVLPGGAAAELLSQRWEGVGIQRPSTLLTAPLAVRAPSPRAQSPGQGPRRWVSTPGAGAGSVGGDSGAASGAQTPQRTPLALPPASLRGARSSMSVSSVEHLVAARRTPGALAPRVGDSTSDTLLAVASAAVLPTVTPGSQHAPSAYARSRASSARSTVATERASGGRTLRTAHNAHAHWHSARYGSNVDAGAVVPVHRSAYAGAERVAGVWEAYMARSLTLQRQVGAVDAPSGMRPAQVFSRTDSNYHAPGGTAPEPSPYPVGVDADPTSDRELVRLGALRCGAEYAYPVKLRNHTPFTRRFRVVAAGWDDAPSTPRALLRLRYKALPIAPGLSATLVLVIRVHEPGVLRGGVALQSDDGELLRVRVHAHAFDAAAFDALRADVQEAGTLVPLANASAVLERAASAWDAEYARTGPVNPRPVPPRASPSRDALASSALLASVGTEGPAFYSEWPSGRDPARYISSGGTAGTWGRGRGKGEGRDGMGAALDEVEGGVDGTGGDRGMGGGAEEKEASSLNDGRNEVLQSSASSPAPESGNNTDSAAGGSQVGMRDVDGKSGALAVNAGVVAPHGVVSHGLVPPRSSSPLAADGVRRSLPPSRRSTSSPRGATELRSSSPTSDLLALTEAHGTTPSQVLEAAIATQRSEAAQQRAAVRAATHLRPQSSPMRTGRNGVIASAAALGVTLGSRGFSSTASIVAHALEAPTGTVFDGKVAVIAERVTIEDVPYVRIAGDTARAALALQSDVEPVKARVPLGGTSAHPLPSLAHATIPMGGTHHLLTPLAV